MKFKRTLKSVLLLPLMLSACDRADSIDEPQHNTAVERAVDTQSRQQPESLEDRRALREQLAEQQAKTLPEPTNMQAALDEPAIGEVPQEIFEKIMADVVLKTRANRADIVVTRTESLTYSDGSLGCSKPGQNYTMATVPGYRVILSHAGQQFDYRASQKGFFMLCERPSLSAPGASSKPPTM